MSLDWSDIPALLFAALLVTAAVYDWMHRRIPNWTVLLLLIVFIPAFWLDKTPTLLSCLGAFGIALVASGALYLLGWVGAGDSKLFTAAALFLGLSNLLLFFVATVLVGGLMAVGVLVIHPKRVMRGLTARGRAENKSRGIPYGVAIAAGALIAAFVSNFLPNPYDPAHRLQSLQPSVSQPK